MEYEKAHAFLINKLEKELPQHITYHNVQHTKNVIKAAEYLGERENISADDMSLLKTAALFHDSGFIKSHNQHETHSCEIAKKNLPQFKYSPAQVEQICTMIMATKVPQKPKDYLSRLLCDADLYYLGGDSYEANSHNLYKEFRKNKIIKTNLEWNIRQAEFLAAHKYFSDTAIREREPGKQETLKRMKSKLEASLPGSHKESWREKTQDFILNILGVGISAFALKCFLVPNRFFDGGITGLSLLLHEIYHFDLSTLIFILNLPLVILSYFTLGKQFSIRIFISILLFGICLLFVPELAITNDKLLIAVFGGIFLGMGIGLVMRAGAALDGIEVLALYTLKRTSFTITEIILGLNIVIFGVAAFEFGIETSLYSILTYFAATRTIDYVVEGIQAYTGVTIISGKSEAIKYELVNSLGRGITVYKGERGFLPGHFEVSTEVDIIFTVITRMEIRKLTNLVYQVDPKAFIFANTIKEAAGGIIKRRHSH
ncbi:MAG: YitT family protein [Ginsengibacter sp.]